MYNKMYFSMDSIYSANIYFKSESIRKAKDSYGFSENLLQPYNHFIKINEIIYYSYDVNSLIRNLLNHAQITYISYAMPRTDLLALSDVNIMLFLSLPNDKKSKKLKNKYVAKLKKLTPMRKIADYFQPDCIIDMNGKCLKLSNDKFILQDFKDDADIVPDLNTPRNKLIDAYIYKYINSSFVYGEYQITDRIKDLVCKITGNNSRSLKTIAKLTAAAYSNNLSLKAAVVIVAKGNAYKETERFFEKLFDGNIYTLRKELLKNKKTFFDAYTDTSLMGGGAYIIKDEQALKSQITKSIVKSTYFEINDNSAGKIKFKNKLPLIVLTQNEEFAQHLSNDTKYYTVNADADFCMSNISTDDLVQIRQALSLYGLRLLLSPQIESNSPVSNETLNQDIIDEFVRTYCKKTKNGIIGKSVLKDAFNDFARTHCSNFEGSSLAVCKKLQSLGCDTTRKKRIDGNKNPVGVIIGAEFDSEKFDNDMKLAQSPAKIEKTELKKDSFEDEWIKLLSTTV